MDCKLEIEYRFDMENSKNSIFIVTTQDDKYKDIVGEGKTVGEAIDDFDTKCEKIKKCA